MAEKNPKRRKKALNALDELRAVGASGATFHPDGSLASVSFPVASQPPAPVAAPTASTVQEVLASPRWPKTDLDALDNLPDYDKENGN